MKKVVCNNCMKTGERMFSLMYLSIDEDGCDMKYSFSDSVDAPARVDACSIHCLLELATQVERKWQKHDEECRIYDEEVRAGLA